MTMSILFLWRWELVIVTYHAWNKSPESIFQITRGQWGTSVQPRSPYCCFLWVKYGVKTRSASVP